MSKVQIAIENIDDELDYAIMAWLMSNKAEFQEQESLNVSFSRMTRTSLMELDQKEFQKVRADIQEKYKGWGTLNLSSLGAKFEKYEPN